MSHYDGSPEERRALDAYIKLMRATNSVTTYIDEPLARLGITHGQFGVLEALLHLGPLCQGDLSAKLLTSGGNLTTVVGNLERRGLVTRTRGDKDRRFVTVDLTEQGRALIAGYFPKHADRIRRALSPLSEAEQETLAHLCRKLGRADREP